VLATVELNDKAVSMTDEINDVWTDGYLPTKVHAFCAESSQGSPDQPFGIG
jgi:hypothetical protein